MRRFACKSIAIPLLGAFAMLAPSGITFVIGAQAAHAQTLGMGRRQDRRATRQEARGEKRECNASGDSTHAGCRQEKRDVRQSGRQAHTGSNPAENGIVVPDYPS